MTRAKSRGTTRKGTPTMYPSNTNRGRAMCRKKNASPLRGRRFAPVVLFILSLAVTTTVAAESKSLEGKWLQELAGAEGGGFTGYPQSLGWQADHPESYPSPFLIVGTRPVGDKPKDGVALRGEKRSDGDWVVADGSGAVWVTGLPAPEPGKPVVLSGRFTKEGGTLALKGIRFLITGVSNGKTVARKGDFVYYPLAGTKSSTCPVEVEGDAAEVAFTDERDTLIVRAVKPGTAKIKLFSLWFTDDKPTPSGENLLTVE